MPVCRAAGFAPCVLLLAIAFRGGNAEQIALKAPPRPDQRRPVPPAQFGSTALKRYVLSANGFNVEINAAGNAPFFVYYADGKEASKQRMWMEKMWQTAGTIGGPATPPIKKINLGGMYDWVFSTPATFNSTLTNSTTETIFTMLGIPKTPGDANNPKPNLLFTNHLISSANGTELKFDVEISNYADAWWDPSATGLVLAYRMETLDQMDAPRDTPLQGMKKLRDAKRPLRPVLARNASGGQPPPKADAIDLGNGYGFESATVAADGAQRPINATVDVGMDESKPHILVVYGRFSQILRHDPVMYTADTSSAADPAATAAAPSYDAGGNLQPSPPPGAPATTTPRPASTPKSSSSSAVCANMALVLLLSAALLAAST